MSPIEKILGLVVACALLLIAGFFGLKAFSSHHQKIGYDRAVSEYTEKAAQAMRQLQDESDTMRRQLDEANENANLRETALRIELDSLRTESERLRDELQNSRNRLSTASCASARKRAAALADVFEHCKERYESLAGKADRHASDALMFEQAWPKPRPSPPAH